MRHNIKFFLRSHFLYISGTAFTVLFKERDRERVKGENHTMTNRGDFNA